MRKAYIEPDGIEITFPDEIYLDNNHIRRTVQCIIAEGVEHREKRKFKRDQRQAKRRKSFWK